MLALAWVLGSGFLQEKEVSVLEERVTVLRKKASGSERAVNNDRFIPFDERLASKEQPEFVAEWRGADGTVDWEKFLDLFRSIQATADMFKFFELQASLSELSDHQLAEGIRFLDRQVDASAVRSSLEDVLGKKNPRLLLEISADRIGTGDDWSLIETLQTWAKDDPMAALAWVDEQQAAGKFESKSLHSMFWGQDSYREAVYPALFHQEPDEFARQMARLTADQQKEIAQQSTSWELPLEVIPEYYRFLNEHLERGDIPAKIGLVVGGLTGFRGSFEQADEALARLNLSGDETRLVYQTVVAHRFAPGMVDLEGIETAESWLQAKMPGQAMEVLIDALAESFIQNSYSETLVGMVPLDQQGEEIERLLKEGGRNDLWEALLQEIEESSD